MSKKQKPDEKVKLSEEPTHSAPILNSAQRNQSGAGMGGKSEGSNKGGGRGSK
jgi:hypothetical protein